MLVVLKMKISSLHRTINAHVIIRRDGVSDMGRYWQQSSPKWQIQSIIETLNTVMLNLLWYFVTKTVFQCVDQSLPNIDTHVICIFDQWNFQANHFKFIIHCIDYSDFFTWDGSWMRLEMLFNLNVFCTKIVLQSKFHVEFVVETNNAYDWNHPTTNWS